MSFAGISLSSSGQNHPDLIGRSQQGAELSLAVFAWEGAAPAWGLSGSAVFCLGAAANRAIWGFICILHSQPRGVLQGGIFIPIQLFAAVFLLPGLPDVLSSCVQPQLWSRERRWQRPEGLLEVPAPSWVPGGIPWGDPAAPGSLRTGWGGIPALVALSWGGHLPNIRGFTDVGWD